MRRLLLLLLALLGAPFWVTPAAADDIGATARGVVRVVTIAVVDGQVELAGPSLALGYLGDDARTEAAFVVRDGERWYRTGDAGSVSDDGVLAVSGRLDDVVVSGGEKVSLGLVERVVREQPGRFDGFFAEVRETGIYPA